MSKARIKLTPSELEAHLDIYISNCEQQIKKNILPTSLCVEGAAGIGKTSLLRQVAARHGYKLVTLNTAMIDDLGHLMGFPNKEYELEYTDTSAGVQTNYTKWVPSEFAEAALQDGGKFTGGSRMGYAHPEWLKTVHPDEKFILLLDDFTRGLPMVMQACMTLVEEYKYGSWALPKNSIILLSTNPDNGEYSVTSLDTAQKTRMRCVEMVFDASSWARWAETAGIDGRCINFVLANPELFSTKKDGIGGAKEYNARIMTRFFNEIGCLPDFSKQLGYVKICGDSSVGAEFTNHFTTFINNKLDLLPNPKELFEMPIETAKAKLTEICGNYKVSGSYNPATASIFANRLTNFIIYTDHAKWGKDENAKSVELILHNAFGEDLKFYMARQFTTDRAKAQNSRLQMITMNPEILKMILAV